ncbi:C3a anaphylatoxin chemotactic receptor-like [Scyliorhinus canicula]|uniref:C3a anaphylatoxin chemotactic receptor-like n=1 Tax=Scyliorhinus canicula TaxID=7830 RepID=UPI0018F65D8F|nr:C3a anaphylatoxin chemotactic receptor-like [Scyliorhinus canicula]
MDYDDESSYLDYGNWSDDLMWNDTYFVYDYKGDDESTPQLNPPSILAIAIYVITFLVGIPGNAAVIWVTGCKMKRTVNSVWFLNLAVADLAYCCSLPFQIANTVTFNHWPTDVLLCKLIPSAIVLNMAASVFILSAVSVDRCLAITRPIWSQRRRTVGAARIACAGAWLLALLMCLPTLLHRSILKYPDLGLSYCSYNYSQAPFGQRTKQVVEVSRVLVVFALPFLLMAACYLLIALKVRRARFAKSRKPIRLIAVVVAAFFACWLPYHVFGLMQAFNSHSVALRWDYAAVGLASVNSALNPILYVFMGRDFRQRFRRSLASSLRLAFSEDLTQSVTSSRLKSRTSIENNF